MAPCAAFVQVTMPAKYCVVKKNSQRFAPGECIGWFSVSVRH